MIKTTYYCDCCKEVIPDGAAHIQLLPTTGGSPFVDRAAVYRMYRDGMSYKEIAERIGKTPVRVGQIVREMIENERLSD